MEHLTLPVLDETETREVKPFVSGVADRRACMGDMKSRGWIVAKGIMFSGIVLGSAGLIFLEVPSVRMATLLVFLVWSSCRFYYFLFYVLEKYVDPSLRYAGLWAFVAAIKRNRAVVKVA
jgi:hypothetical protein